MDAPPAEELLTLQQIAQLWGISRAALDQRRHRHQADFDRDSVCTAPTGKVGQPRRWPRAAVDRLAADPRFSRPIRHQAGWRKNSPAALDARALAVRAAQGGQGGARGEAEGPEAGDEEEAPREPPKRSSGVRPGGNYPEADPNRPVRVHLSVKLTYRERAALNAYPDTYGVTSAELVRALLVRRLRRAGLLPMSGKVVELEEDGGE